MKGVCRLFWLDCGDNKATFDFDFEHYYTALYPHGGLRRLTEKQLQCYLVHMTETALEKPHSLAYWVLSGMVTWTEVG